MEPNLPNKKVSPPSKVEHGKEESHVIPAGTEQETGLSRFIKTPDENPEEIKDAKLNNLEEQDPDQDQAKDKKK
jgi:hypothetical protein